MECAQVMQTAPLFHANMLSATPRLESVNTTIKLLIGVLLNAQSHHSVQPNTYAALTSTQEERARSIGTPDRAMHTIGAVFPIQTAWTYLSGPCQVTVS